jgi:phosphomannomutase/phosphoglucomutase
VECPDDVKFTVVAQITEAFRRTHDVIDVDGVRVLFSDGWGLVRASNTQPALVVRAEATTTDGLARIKGELTAALGRFPTVGSVPW